MNEKLKYAEMLEIPINSCNITYKPTKKKRQKNQTDDQVKNEVIEKVNLANEATKSDSKNSNNVDTVTISNTVKKPKFKLTVVGVELCVICCLVFTIILTSAILPNSGLTSFFSSAYKGKQVEVDNRTFADFTPVFSTVSKEDVVTNNGIMTMKNQSSVYAPCDGEVASIVKDENDLYTITIKHSENFKTVISGAKYVYVNQGDKIYSTIPVAYTENEIDVCFVDGVDNIITENVNATCSLWEQEA